MCDKRLRIFYFFKTLNLKKYYASFSFDILYKAYLENDKMYTIIKALKIQIKVASASNHTVVEWVFSFIKWK